MVDSFYIPDKVTLELLDFPVFKQCGVELAVLRLDKTDPLISGNKWFKLHYHIRQAKMQDAVGLISVGGAHSNHLHALAVAGQQAGLATIGLVRGEPKQTATSEDLQHFGMHLHWLSYGEYRRRYQPVFWQEWLCQYPNYYFVPEGGGGILGAKGCKVIPKLIDQQLSNIGWPNYDMIYLGVGTGSTLAGIVWGDDNQHTIVGCLATPTSYGVTEQIITLLAEIPIAVTNYQLRPASRKGFGRVDTELLAFMREIEQQGLLLDPVYTAKALYFLKQQVITGEIPKGTRIVFIHTGGLQGRRELERVPL